MNATSDFTFIFDYFERNSEDEIDTRSIDIFGLQNKFWQELLTEMMKWTTRTSLNSREFHRVLTTTIAD